MSRRWGLGVLAATTAFLALTSAASSGSTAQITVYAAASLTDVFPQIEKRMNVPRPQPLVVGHRQHDGDVAVLSANHDRTRKYSVICSS